jgi:hypothetical protein
MPAITLIIEVSDAPDVLEEDAAATARINRQFGATRREAFAIGEREGVRRGARAALGERASAEEVEALARTVERGDTGATLALLASR